MIKFNKYIVRFSLCVLLAFPHSVVSGRDAPETMYLYIDSLVSLLNNLPEESYKLYVLDEISYNHWNVDSTYRYAIMELDLGKKLHSDYYVGRANEFLGWYYCMIDDYDHSINHYQDAINCFDSLSDSYNLAISHKGLANAMSLLGYDIQAYESFLRALDLFVSLGNDTETSDIYRSMGSIRVEYHLYESANNCISKAFALDSLMQDSVSLAEDFFMLGWSFYKQYLDFGNSDYLFYAKKNMLKGYELASIWDHSVTILWMSSELMFVYQDVAKMQVGKERVVSLDSAFYFFNVADSMMTLCSIDEQKIYLDIWKANSLSLDGNYDDAMIILKEFERQPDLIDENKLYLYRAMTSTYESSGDYVNALKYARLLNNEDRETYNRDFAVRVTSGQYERKLSEQKHSQQKQRYTLLFMKLCLGMVSVILLVFLYGLLRNRKLNRQLTLQNNEIAIKNANLNESNAEIFAQREEIEAQRDSLEETSQMLQSSINYAKHIQDGVMVSHESMHRIFGDILIYWKPMNVVSGDFYWAMQKGNFKMLVLADCTGHGVPGAFMSMFAISSLNNIVSPLNFENIKASDVLDMLRAKVIVELHQTSTSGDSIESVDMALCIIDTNKMQVQYAGANRPLLIVRDGNIIVYKPDKMPVGLHIIRKDPFVNNVIDLKKNDVLYMYTDGITDQFGSEDDDVASENFTTKRLDNLLLNIVDKPFAEQADIIDRTLTDWRTMPDKTMIDQYDDQLLLGVRIS